MPRVTKLDNENVPPLEALETRLISLPDEEALSLHVDDDTFLIVLHIADLGFLVTGCGQGERDYFTLIDRSLGDDPVTAFDGGDTHQYPRFAFVGKPMLLTAVKTYYETGERDSECEWVLDRDAVYK